MNPIRLSTTATTIATLALAMLAGAFPASAAAGFHAAWVAQSAYASAQPGQVVQMSAVYQNTGDEPWIKGQLGRQVNFGAGSTKDGAYPRDTSAYTAWSTGQGWLSPNRFAAQANDVVATSQLGSWIWSVQVPSAAPAGVTRFHGTPVVDGVAWLEDYGFYLDVTVASGPVLITSFTPPSPSAVTNPTVNGTGAGASCTVSIYEGSTLRATGTSDASGSFAIQLSALAVGTHVLSASADCAGTFRGSGNSVGYVVLSGPPAGAATASNTREIVFNFGQCVDSTSATNPANYAISGGVAIQSIAMNTGNTSVTILTTSPMANPSGHTIDVTGVLDCSGNAVADQFATFTVNDTTPPTIAQVIATAPTGGTTQTVTVRWSEPIGTAGSPGSCVGSYAVDGITATPAGHTDATATGQRECVLTTGQPLSVSTAHTLTVGVESDQGGTQQATNPLSASFTVGVTPTIKLLSAVASGESAITLNWNVAVDPTTGSATCQTPDASFLATCTLGAPMSGSSTQQDVTISTPPFGANGCAATSCVITVTVSGVTDPTATLVMSPASQLKTATVLRDTVAPSLSTAAQVGTGQNTFDLTWSERVSAPLACVAAGTCAIRIYSGAISAANIKASTIPNENAGVSLTISACDGVAGDRLTRLTLQPNGTAYAPCAAAGAALRGASYTLTTAAAVVQDLAGTPNASVAGSRGLAVTDTTRPTVIIGSSGPAAGQCGATQPCRVFTITFSERMADSGSGSVTSTANYRLNGLAVTGIASIDGTGTVVTLTLSADAPGGSNQIAVLNVRDASSQANLLSPTQVNINFTRTP